MRIGILLAIVVVPAWASTAHAQVPGPWNFDQAYIDASARSHCTELFPDNLSTRAFCIKDAKKGAANLAILVNRFGGNDEIKRGIAHCWDLFTEYGVTNFSTTEFCARDQIKAWKEMNGDGG